jgi:glycosyltransferase involved in cell wall biosynthesis
MVENSERILFLRPVLDTYGVSKVIFQLARTLKKRGYYIAVASDNNDKFKLQFEAIGIRHYTIPLRPDKKNIINFFLCMIKMSQIVRKDKISIIHSHHRWSSFIAFFVSRMMRIPLVTTYHAIHHGKKRLSIWGDKIISVSEDAKKHLMEYFNASPQNIAVIHNGICIPELTCDESLSEGAYTLEHPVIANVARMSPEKDQESLFFAMKKVVTKHPGARLLMVGRGPLENSLRALAEDLGIYHNVEFLGEVEDMDKIFRKTDILVISSLTEGLPIAVLEALAYSKPVVATNVGDIPFVVINRKTGYTVSPKDPEQLADAISYTLSNRDIARMFGRNGRELIKDKFNVERMTSENEKVYMNLMATSESNF